MSKSFHYIKNNRLLAFFVELWWFQSGGFGKFYLVKRKNIYRIVKCPFWICSLPLLMTLGLACSKNLSEKSKNSRVTISILSFVKRSDYEISYFDFVSNFRNLIFESIWTFSFFLSLLSWRQSISHLNEFLILQNFPFAFWIWNYGDWVWIQQLSV